jgi:arylsulfatase A-like enzyme
LLAVDEAIHALVTELGDRLDDTVIFVLSDNGYSFGEHRWEGKKCPYEACVRIPLAVYSSQTPALAPAGPVSIVDLAPTILDLADATPSAPLDGTTFAPAIEDDVGHGGGEHPGAVFLEWAGDERIPPWTAVRTTELTLIRYADGFEELYDLEGRLRPADPWEMRNRAGDPRYAAILTRLRALLGRTSSPG